MAFKDFLGAGPIGAIKEIWTGKQQLKREAQRQLAEFKQAEHEARMKAVSEGRINEAKWNMTSIQKAGWRPGFLTIVLSLPLILVFFPWFVPYIEQGFDVLDRTPVWYRGAIGVMISSAFGYKKYADWQMKKKYE